MGKFDGVLLASDFDDTLYNSKREVSQENIAAIAAFIREGGRFTVSTGRAHRTFTPYATAAPINAPVILSNGAVLWDYALDKLVFESPLPPCAAADFSEMSLALPEVGIEIYHEDEVYIQNPNHHTALHVEKVGTTWTPCALVDMPQPWSKAVLQAPRERLEEAQRFLLGHWAEKYEVIFSNDVLLECTAKGAHKGGAVLRLAELLGVAPQNIYCVGDNQNDLPMLAVSAVPFAPDNCADLVRESNPRIVRHCDDHAIAHVIALLDERYS